MKKFWLLLSLFFFFIKLSCFAQVEDDYVNKNQSKSKPLFNKKIYEISNPDYTSYFLSPTAFTLTKRDFRIASNDFIFVKGTYGLTDKLNISLNTSLFGSLIGSLKQRIDLGEQKSLSFSASLGNFTFTLKDTNILFSSADANFTFGTIQNSITVGTGMSFIKSNIDLVNDKRKFLMHFITFGLQNQLSRKVYFMVDGYYFTNYNILTAAAGFKFVIKTRYTLNAGVMPILWNDTRRSRYDIKPMMIPVVSFRMLIERKN